MLGRCVLIALVGGATLSASVLDCLSGPGFQGLYGGASIGAQNFGSSVNQEFNAVLGTGETPPPFNLRVSVDPCKVGVWGEIFVGYGCTPCDWLYLGARLGSNFSSSELVVTAKGAAIFEETPLEPSLVGRFKMNSVEPTLDAKPGFVFCEDTMLFGLIGVALNRAEADLNFLLRFVVSEEAQFSLDSNHRTSDDVWGARFGFGLERLICCRYGLCVTYVYTVYPSKQGSIGDPQALLLDEVGQLLVRMRPSRQVASIGLSYYF
jgi:opacity protein-like surface antigen